LLAWDLDGIFFKVGDVEDAEAAAVEANRAAIEKVPGGGLDRRFDAGGWSTKPSDCQTR